ncbi:hypothetical protein F5879DRAFT_407707 [Lentinula edodes]|nr:hypothetical protein F5879DRAFT_407707 [Lentinula edodes]
MLPGKVKIVGHIDLQAHMDLLSTLETSLGDSEKNPRMQSSYTSTVDCHQISKKLIHRL